MKKQSTKQSNEKQVEAEVFFVNRLPEKTRDKTKFIKKRLITLASIKNKTSQELTAEVMKNYQNYQNHQAKRLKTNERDLYKASNSDRSIQKQSSKIREMPEAGATEHLIGVMNPTDERLESLNKERLNELEQKKSSKDSSEQEIKDFE